MIRTISELAEFPKVMKVPQRQFGEIFLYSSCKADTRNLLSVYGIGKIDKLSHALKRIQEELVPRTSQEILRY